jgi:hypothetical protein
LTFETNTAVGHGVLSSSRCMACMGSYLSEGRRLDDGFEAGGGHGLDEGDTPALRGVELVRAREMGEPSVPSSSR